MKITFRPAFLIIATLSLSQQLLGQSKPIPFGDYRQREEEAAIKTSKQIRKTVSIQKLYSNGKVTSTTVDIREIVPPDKLRLIHIETLDDVEEKTEEIYIGDFHYLRKNNGKWVKLKEPLSGFGSGGDNRTREYFIEEEAIKGEKLTVLIMKTTDHNKTYLTENRVWINEKGLYSKTESTVIALASNRIVSLTESAYNYPKKIPKIEPPIK